jgi:CDP-paratose 2-epimerase
MTRILIAGGCGFVGAAVCRRLLAMREGLAITVLDSLRRPGAETNRAALMALGVRVIHGDVRMPTDIEAAAAGVGFEWVLDAAAEPSVVAGTAAGSGCTTAQLVDHNLVGTCHLIEAAARWRAGVVLLSTSRVYSIPALLSAPLRVVAAVHGDAFAIDPARPLPEGLGEAGISERFSTAPPVSLYGATKIAGEIMALEYAHRFGTPLFVNRCGVMAGAGQFGHATQGIFSWWIHSWAARRPLSYIGFGGLGRQVRDCLHPDDLADLVDRQIAAGFGPPAVCNVSGGRPSAMSLAQLSGWCTARFGPRPVASAEADRPYDLPWAVLDHTLASARFGWHPERGVEDILSEIADHAARHPDWLDRCGG